MGAFDFGAAAGGVADAFQELLRQRFLEQVQAQRVAEDMARREQQDRQFNANLDLNQRKFAEDSRQFERTAGQRDRQIAGEEAERPVRLAHTEAQTNELRRKPMAEHEDRAYTTARDKTQHGYRMQEIGASKVPMPKDERLVQVEGPDGRPTWVRESDAVGRPAAQAARAVTGQERGVLAFYNRAKDASDTISKPDATGSSLEDRVAKSGVMSQLGLQYAPNMLQTPDQQAYRQAQRAFTEARLRKESGAAIPTAEYENDAKTYFAQPGDSPQLIEQKRQKRQVVLEGLKFSSGRAYDEFYGQPNQQPDGNGGAGGPKVGDTKTFPNGKQGRWDGKGWVLIGG